MNRTSCLVTTAVAGLLAAGCGEEERRWPQFTDIGAGLTGLSGRSLAWGDYDNDGDLDLAVSGQDNGSWINKIYRNEGGTFVDVEAGLDDVSYCSLAWGDYDGDGDIDLVLAGVPGAVYENQGAGVFAKTGADLLDTSYASVAWGDLDNDGDLDLAVAGNIGITECSSTVYRNDAGVFSDIGAGLMDMGDSSLAWGDYDNDGDLDLALAGWNMYGVYSKIYRNDGPGVFTDTGAQLIEVGGCSLAWGDYDNDGDLDLVLAGLGMEGPTSRIARNDGGVFTHIDAGLADVWLGSLAWGDYDNDGDLDLALVGEARASQAVAKVYRNEEGSFEEVSSGLRPLKYGTVAWGDYDNDGDLDLAIAGNDGANAITRIYRNDGQTFNTAPTAPWGLDSFVLGSDVLLSWNTATDAETPVAGLSFNLRVRPESGTEDVMPGMADPVTGYRRIPALGNAQKRLFWILEGLAPGTYYWSVQAIDTAFAGSPWAPEETVTVP